MSTVFHFHRHQRHSRVKETWTLSLGHRKLTLFQVDVHVGSRGNREGDGGVRGVSEDDELEGDMFLELYTDGVGLFEEGSV